MSRKRKLPRFGAQGFPVRRDPHLHDQSPNGRPLESRFRAAVEGLLSAASNSSNGSEADFLLSMAAIDPTRTFCL